MASYLYQRVLLISFLRCSNLLQSLMKSSPMILWMRLVLGRKNLEANLSSFLIFYPKQFRNNYSSKEIRMGMYNLLINVARIETEKMLIQMVETELECRKIAGAYKHHFQGQSHFFGYEGRCGLPSNFDSNYCYSLGYAAGALLHSGKTGLISAVGNLNAPVEEWTVGGTALTSLMDVERRHGKFKPVIKKAMVELEGAPFKKFASVRDEWAIKNRYVSPAKINNTVETSSLPRRCQVCQLFSCLH